MEQPRRCVFIGTTNATANYLPDATGNRRFWPVTIGKIDLAKFRRDRDQLIAEAVAMYDAGERWWIEDDLLLTKFEEEQAARHEHDLWERDVATYLDLLVVKEVTLIQVAESGLGLKEKRDLNHDARTRIGKILSALEWHWQQRREKVPVPGTNRVEKKVTRFYSPNVTPDDSCDDEA